VGSTLELRATVRNRGADLEPSFSGKFKLMSFVLGLRLLWKVWRSD
jgi:hypothetical protein